MKTKLLLSILLLTLLFQSNAQNVLPAMKPRPADYEYLSAPDSLGVRHSLKMPSVANKNTLTTQTKLPYPIIFIHGLNSWSETWNTFTNYIDSTFGLSFGGRFDISLNDDNDLTSANLNVFPSVGADIAMYPSTVNFGADYYYVNFAVNSAGAVDEACANLSNQSAIAKQGLALRDVIIYVMQLTGRDKVILMGHSMGGLAAREYLQNPSNWVNTNTNHGIAKLVTTGTPHGGSNATATFLGSIFTNIDERSEAIRDLRTSYYYSPNAPGVFLYGGTESNYIMDDSILGSFYNIDVNCNGIPGENIIGLNQKTPQYNLDYSCIIGTGVNVGNTDSVVFTNNANINNVGTFNPSYANLTQNIFYSPVIHTNLPKQIYQNIQGLDEPYEYDKAYGIGFNKYYTGFITEQSQYCPYSTDFDDYKFTLTNTSNISISINTPTSLNLSAELISNDQTTQIGITYSNNATSNISFTQNNLAPGNYFLQIYGTPIIGSISSYNFNLSSSLSTDTFDSNNTISLFPNPTSSKVFFDNSNSNFKEVAIYNYLGQEVTKTSFNSSTNNQTIDMGNLASGVYVLKLSNGETSKSVKVIKQ